MIIYKDILTDEEVLSDSYKCKVIDGVLYEVEGKLTTEKTVVTDSMIGGNKSAEDEGGDDAEDASKSGINVVLAHNLREVAGTKKDFKMGIKKYMQKIVGKLKESDPDQVEQFKAVASKIVADVLARFDDFQLFTGESFDYDPIDGEAMFIFVEYRGETPYLTYFKHGLQEEKM
ncbi:translationally-controlled tumor protein homolog [Acropora muricata]|uniref:translationally-controlled tumor protein homolog n=1 Tax=Acropora millepora TaxID=45264 RepID=UPI0010FC86C3|nr:translationally-controlled tumor protein homolog [Acropora millepora]